MKYINMIKFAIHDSWLAFAHFLSYIVVTLSVNLYLVFISL